MNQPTEELRVVQISLNQREALFITWSMYLAGNMISGSIVGQVEGLVQSRTAIQNLGQDGYIAFVTRLQALMRAGFPHLEEASDEPVGSTIGLESVDCEHCTCSDPVCCYCLRPKP